MQLNNEKLELIRQDKYEWSDEEVEEVYKLAQTSLKNMRFKDLSEREDLIQELAMHFFNYAVKKYDPEKNVKISTFAVMAMNSKVKMYYRSSAFKKNKELPFSLDSEIESDTEKLLFYDVLKDEKILSPLQQYEKDMRDNYVKQLCENNPIIYDYYIEGLNQEQLSKKYNISQSYVSRIIKKVIDKTRKEYDQMEII